MAGTNLANRQLHASWLVCLAGTFDCHLKKIISDIMEKIFYNSNKKVTSIEGITTNERNVLYK